MGIIEMNQKGKVEQKKTTKQINRYVLVPQVSKKRVWFNQIYLDHTVAVTAEVAAAAAEGFVENPTDTDSIADLGGGFRFSYTFRFESSK